jgi:hypothetical protein
MTNSPDARGLPQPSAAEIGAMPPLVPLFSMDKYELEGREVEWELRRATQTRAKLGEYYTCQMYAFAATFNQFGVRTETVAQLGQYQAQLHEIISDYENAQYRNYTFRDYIDIRNNFFANLRAFGEYPEHTIAMLDAYEQSVRSIILFDHIDPLDFAEQVNKDNVAVPHVTPKVRELWAKRSDTHGLVTAIQEQILAQYPAAS